MAVVQTNYSQNNYASLLNDTRTRIAQKLLMTAKYNLRFYSLAFEGEQIGSGNGISIKFVDYPLLPTPGATITEGVDPVGRQLTNSTKIVTAEQWGDIIGVTDITELTIYHNVVNIIQTRLAEQAQRLIDREVQEVIKGASLVYYGNSKTTRPNLTTSDTIKKTDIQKGVARLRTNGAETYDGKYYVGVMDVATEFDLLNNATNFDLASAYLGDGAPIYAGEVGRYMGVRWITSNFMPVLFNNTTAAIAMGATATSGTVGSLANATAYHYQVVARHIFSGFEQVIFANGTETTGAGDTSLDITMPSDTAYEYDLYMGTSAVNMKLHSFRNAASAVVNVKTIPTTTALAPSVPGANVYVHTTYIFGKGSYGVANLMNLSFHMTPSGSAVGNVLELARYFGWKVMFKAAILNSSFYVKIEAHSDFGI